MASEVDKRSKAIGDLWGRSERARECVPRGLPGPLISGSTGESLGRPPAGMELTLYSASPDPRNGVYVISAKVP